MENAQLFTLANAMALLGWLVLLASPWFPKFAEWVSGRIIPIFLSVGYTSLIMLYWADAEGGFSSLADVMALFTQPETVLIGWIHFLAFDLFIGAWECRTARRENIAFWFVIPCLILTFQLGPIGLFLFMVIRAIAHMKRSAKNEEAVA